MCDKKEKYKLTNVGFTNEDIASTYITTELIEDTVQLEKQDASIDQYMETHLLGKHSDEIIFLMNEFQAFISLNIIGNLEHKFVLDVGCGISKTYPIYFNKLKNIGFLSYVGLDPFDVNKTDREYLFINGKFEGLNRYLDHKFDYLIFSTSLDHFENLEDVKDEIRKVLKPNGIVFFWIGLHDCDLVARQSIYKFFEHFKILNFKDLIIKMIKTPLYLFLLYKAMRKRSYKLNNKIPLDDLHFHYFTRSSIDKYIKSLGGSVVDTKIVPFSNSIMYAVAIY